MSAAALYSLDSPACYRSWCLEPANFYDAGGGPGGSGSNLAELSAAAPAMYEDESAIDFSSYIDSMSAVPNLELCNDELFADLFNSNHKPERAPKQPGCCSSPAGTSTKPFTPHPLTWEIFVNYHGTG
uniref:Uncharacterized protein n=1 Tax=Cairina moschata TaxID=8855 RepID=A0A8C3BE79_CAIMO